MRELTVRFKWGGNPKVLAEAIEALAISQARTALGAVNETDITDSTTGTAGETVVSVPTQKDDATITGSTGAPKTGVDAALEKVDDRLATLSDLVNEALDGLGLDDLTANSTGTAAAPSEGAVALAAMDKTVTGNAGTTAVLAERHSFNAAVIQARNNVATIARALNNAFVAVGLDPFADNSGGVADNAKLTLVDQDSTGTAVSAAAGGAVTKAAADAALTALANNVAFLVDRIEELYGATAAVAVRVVP